MDFWFGLFFKNSKHKDIITLLVHHDASIKYFLPAKGFAWNVFILASNDDFTAPDVTIDLAHLNTAYQHGNNHTGRIWTTLKNYVGVTLCRCRQIHYFCNLLP